jgi:hypothetical protein
MKLYLINKKYNISILISVTQSEDDKKFYEKYYKNFYAILFDKKLINKKTILIFCNYNKLNEKKELSIQPSTESNQDILNKLSKDINTLNLFIINVLKQDFTNYMIVVDDTIKFYKNKIKLNCLIEMFN